MNRTTTWNNIGTNVETCNNNVNEVLLKAGLDYEVISETVYTKEGIALDGYQALVRDSDSHLYNIVKSNYTPVQNKDAFSALSEISNDIQIIKAGETGSGIVYIIAKSGEFNVLDDAFENYIIFQNSHNYASSLRAAITPLRIICQNQFNSAFQNASNSVSFRHTSSVLDNLKEMGNVLKQQYYHTAALKEFAERAAIKKISLGNFLLKMFPENAEMTQRQLLNLQESRQQFADMYNSADNSNFVNTGWGIINTAADYMTHSKNRRKTSEESKFLQTLDSNNFLRKAIQIVNAA